MTFLYRLAALALLLSLANCGDDGFKSQPLAIGNAAEPTSWEVGPVIDGVSRSVNVPLKPAVHPDGLAIDIPHPTRDAGHLHSATINPGSLAGKSRITLRYRVEMADDVKIVPASPPGWVGPALLSVYFQRCGDNWTASPDKYETYRWWASSKLVQDIRPGDGEISASLTDDVWTAITDSTSLTKPAEFEAAKADTCRVGISFGGGDGLAHGFYATGPARFVIKDFVIE
jgi:hypothetical protein